MTDSAHLSIAICTFERPQCLRRCLEALAAQSVDSREFEILVIDNNSTAQTASVVQEFAQSHGRTRLIRETKQGKSHAANRALGEALSEYVAFLDDDTVARGDWLETVVEALGTVEPHPVVLGGKVECVYETDPPAWYRRCFELDQGMVDPGFVTAHGICYGIVGANLVVHRASVLALGGFDVAMGPVGRRYARGEDSDLVLRVFREGLPVYSHPLVVVRHTTPIPLTSLRESLRRVYLSGKAFARLEEIRLLSKRTLGGLSRRVSSSLTRAVADVAHGASRELGPPRETVTIRAVRLLRTCAHLSGIVRGMRLY